MERLFGICDLSVVPVRAEASHKSECVSQLLFGDRFEILEERGGWCRIQTAYDDYEGWIEQKQSARLSLEEYVSGHDLEWVTGLNPVNALTCTSGGTLYLAPGSSLSVLENKKIIIGNKEYLCPAGTVTPHPDDFSSLVQQAAQFYLGAPYLWGGRTPFGIDCSGFCQVVFKQFGFRLKRDSSQQALQGETVDFLPAAKAGDLAFFDNEEGKIIHVGIMLGNSRIIHASGRVKIDTIDDQGIYSEELKRHTHKLRIIRRMILS